MLIILLNDAAKHCLYFALPHLQLDGLRIAEWAYAGIIAVAVRFQNQDQFWIPHQKLHGACVFDFFKKLKNELV